MNICITESFSCTPVTNETLKNNYTSIKLNLQEKRADLSALIVNIALFPLRFRVGKNKNDFTIDFHYDTCFIVSTNAMIFQVCSCK